MHCCRVLYMCLLTYNQHCFTILEVAAADLHELMIPRHILRPCIARSREQLGPEMQHDRYMPKLATLGLHPVALELLLISHPTRSRRLSWPEHNPTGPS